MYDPLDPDRRDLDTRRAPGVRDADTGPPRLEEWNREATYGVTDVPGVGAVDSWVDLLHVSGPLVAFRWTYVFAADGQTLTSDSTLRCRERQEVEAGPAAQGYVVEDVRDAPDRAGSSCSSHSARKPPSEGGPADSAAPGNRP